MNAVTTLTGKYTTSCKFCKRAVAESSSLDIPIVGEPGNRAKELQMVLVRHLMKHHAEQFAEGALLLDEVLSFLILSAFDSQDPSIEPRVEAIRARVFTKVRKLTMDDENLSRLTQALNLREKDQEKVYAAMQAVRDACCEFGDFAQPAEPSALLTP